MRSELGFRVIGYVVMPEHVHLLISEASGATPSIVLHRLKLRIVKRLRKRRRRAPTSQLSLPFEDCKEAPRAFWQPRFHDFNVYSTRKKAEKLHYMHANPVKRGLVSHPREWLWSSWGFYHGQKTLLAVDTPPNKNRKSLPQDPGSQHRNPGHLRGFAG